MAIKLKSLLNKATEQKFSKSAKSGKEIFREFVEKASSQKYRDDLYWEELRNKLNPKKFKDVDAMFARWQVLAGIKSKN